MLKKMYMMCGEGERFGWKDALISNAGENEKGKKKMVILITSILILVLSIIVTIGVIYMYKWEMEDEYVWIKSGHSSFIVGNA